MISCQDFSNLITKLITYRHIICKTIYWYTVQNYYTENYFHADEFFLKILCNFYIITITVGQK